MGKTPFPLPAIILLLSTMAGYAALQPEKIFSDHMVLQQDTNVQIWGIADAKKVVIVRFDGQTVKKAALEINRSLPQGGYQSFSIRILRTFSRRSMPLARHLPPNPFLTVPKD